jgi:PhzF family phenazine biosynthesis protein
MADFQYRLLNVFTLGDDRFSGNPLCVFERADGLSDEQMQSLARQFNLSETTFVFPPTSPEATARVRIFTPAFEMPFAGHPTLGTAHVVRAVTNGGDRVVLEMKAGHVQVTAQRDGQRDAQQEKWTLRAAQAPRTRAPQADRAQLAAMLGVRESAVGSTPLWVDTGSEQLVIPLASAEAVHGARPNAELLARHGHSDKRESSLAYVWARDTPGQIVARFFFLTQAGVVEDPATGSACANLGGWLLATGAVTLPLKVRVRQGDAVGRPSALDLEIDEKRDIYVGGGVLELGRGTITL